MVWQVLLSSVPTDRRYRFFRSDSGHSCLLCGQGEDSLEHLCVCAVAKDAFAEVLRGVEGGRNVRWGAGILFLQGNLDGEMCRTAAASVHALLLCRTIICRSLSHLIMTM